VGSIAFRDPGRHFAFNPADGAHPTIKRPHSKRITRFRPCEPTAVRGK
jgi:hypothetical protein